MLFAVVHIEYVNLIIIFVFRCFGGWMMNNVLIWQRRCPTFRVQRIGQRLEPISSWSKQWTRHRGSQICVSQFRSPRSHRMVTPILTSAATEARVNIEAEVKRREAEATGYGGGGGGQGPGGWVQTILRLLFGSRARYISLYIYPRPFSGLLLPRGPWWLCNDPMVSPGPWPVSPSSGVWSPDPGLGSSGRRPGRRTDTKWGLTDIVIIQQLNNHSVSMPRHVSDVPR